MKVFKITTLTILCLFTHLNISYAQKDYVITKSNDTIYCKIKKSLFTAKTLFATNPEHKEELKYRPVNQKDYTKIDTSNIIQYFFANDTSTYIQKKLPGIKGAVFVKWLVRGRISLYEYTIYSSMSIKNGYGITNYSSVENSTAFWFADNGEKPIKLIKIDGLFVSNDKVGTRKDRENAFIDLFSDCPILQEKLVDAINNSYDFDLIQTFVKKYNKATTNSNRGDYIITKKNDTVLCNIKYYAIPGIYMFAADGKSNYNKIDSTFLDEFFHAVDSTTFKLKILPEENKKKFVRWLEKGRINLFERTILNSDSNNRMVKYSWYINKDASPLVPIKIEAKGIYDIRKHKEQLTALENMLADNNDLLNSFNGDLKYVNFNTDAIIQLYIENYNKEYSARKNNK